MYFDTLVHDSHTLDLLKKRVGPSQIIMGLDDPEHSLVFHSGTRKNSEGKYITDGGRVLSVVSIDDSVAEARLKTYESLNTIKFEGSFHRTDIALNK